MRSLPKTQSGAPRFPSSWQRGIVTERSSRWQRFWNVVSEVPEGKVVTYGQVAALAGLPRHARQVGYALHALPRDSGVPWQRVVNARGEVSLRSEPGWEGLQRALLESEGVKFDRGGRIDLEIYRWEPLDE
ncbi:MAG: MGMT family protein [Thermoanaerobaculia bacterium]|nr:MGMT family protein [Thermoanaerobaculia bacterium]